MALFFMAISVGNYESSLLVSVVHKFSEKSDGSNWLRNNNLIKGKFKYFYWLITLLQVYNLIYYLLCANCTLLNQFRSTVRSKIMWRNVKISIKTSVLWKGPKNLKVLYYVYSYLRMWHDLCVSILLLNIHLP